VLLLIINLCYYVVCRHTHLQSIGLFRTATWYFSDLLTILKSVCHSRQETAKDTFNKLMSSQLVLSLSSWQNFSGKKTLVVLLESPKIFLPKSLWRGHSPYIFATKVFYYTVWIESHLESWYCSGKKLLCWNITMDLCRDFTKGRGCNKLLS